MFLSYRYFCLQSDFTLIKPVKRREIFLILDKLCVCVLFHIYIWRETTYRNYKFWIINFTNTTLRTGSYMHWRRSVLYNITYIRYASTWDGTKLLLRWWPGGHIVFTITYLLSPSFFTEICVLWITCDHLGLHMVFTRFVYSLKMFFEQIEI